MKILVVSSFYRPAYCYGGPVHSIHAMSKNLVQLGHEVSVYTTNANGKTTLDVPLGTPVDIDGIAVHYFPVNPSPIPWPLNQLPYFSRTAGYFRSKALAARVDEQAGQFDVLHLQSPFCHSNVASCRAAQKAAVPYVYQARGVLRPSHLAFRAWKKRLYIALFEKKILKGASGLIALTEDEGDAYRLLGLKNKVYVVPNGIEVEDLLTEVQCPDDPLIKRLEGKTVILFLARLHPTKGLDLLAPAFYSLAQRYGDAVLVVAGPDEFGIADAIKQTASQAGLADRVLFPGLVTGQAKQNLLARADVYALTSYGEGFSMSVLEGLGSATAALVTKACHFDEVQTRGAGLVVDENLPAVTDALDKLLGNECMRRNMATRGRQLVKEKYQWSQVAAKAARMFAEVCR